MYDSCGNKYCLPKDNLPPHSNYLVLNVTKVVHESETYLAKLSMKIDTWYITY